MKPVGTLGGGLLLAFLVSCAPQTSDRISLTDLGASWQVELESGTPVASHVPGFVLEDLVRAEVVPNPYTGTHERDVQWVEDSAWTYSSSFARPAGWSASDSATFEFQGLNVFATIKVNDVSVLRADNAHRTWTTVPFSLLDTNQLRVTFFPTLEEGQRRLDAFGMALPASNEAKPIGQQVSPFVRKPGYQFGWDWGPRLAGPSIHGDVVLQRQGRALGRPGPRGRPAVAVCPDPARRRGRGPQVLLRARAARVLLGTAFLPSHATSNTPRRRPAQALRDADRVLTC